MISYNKVDNSVQAYFGRWADNDDAFYRWYHELSKYFTKHCKNVSAYLVSSIVNDTLCECRVSGMNFYGEAKYNSDDFFSYKLSYYMAGHRLLDKYLMVQSRIAKRIMKEVSKSYYTLNKTAKEEYKEKVCSDAELRKVLPGIDKYPEYLKPTDEFITC